MLDQDVHTFGYGSGDQKPLFAFLSGLASFHSQTNHFVPAIAALQHQPLSTPMFTSGSSGTWRIA
ncbi:hypothetical protein GGQ73_004070 [Rhizobium skierniewicense]|uniref:Uncharacterized protein n=1 Tax=Rhizobium skierniewicense TaxID=984260 RepID=A0A7W6G525_9HYPH|nr:hypothetical protein [Rhizobium skierniewicense]MBB3948096.1 hypothetical protein [Rhizobium skierniewicense]